MKQSHAAEILNVSQGTVSRWESGALLPDPFHRGKIETLIRANANSGSDAALRRLVLTSTQEVHLVCDATHELLAASPARGASWRTDPGEYLGQSLWPFASDEIIQAEHGLVELGWFQRPFQRFCFRTGGNGSDEIPVQPSLLQWETLPLSDGRIGRLTTTLPS